MGKWSCPICNKTLSSPVIAGCGHTFCWRCLCKHMEHQNNCPVCKQYLDYSTFTAIKGIGKEDQDLESLPPLPQSHNDDFSYTSKPPRVNPNPEPDLNAGNNFGNPTNRQEFTTPEGNTIIHEEYNNPDGSITIREETITPDGQRTVHQEITNPYGGRTFQRQFGTPQRDFQPRTARTEFNGYPGTFEVFTNAFTNNPHQTRRQVRTNTRNTVNGTAPLIRFLGSIAFFILMQFVFRYL